MCAASKGKDYSKAILMVASLWVPSVLLNLWSTHVKLPLPVLVVVTILIFPACVVIARWQERDPEPPGGSSEDSQTWDEYRSDLPSEPEPPHLKISKRNVRHSTDHRKPGNPGPLPEWSVTETIDEREPQYAGRGAPRGPSVPMSTPYAGMPPAPPVFPWTETSSGWPSVPPPVAGPAPRTIRPRRRTAMIDMLDDILEFFDPAIMWIFLLYGMSGGLLWAIIEGNS